VHPDWALIILTAMSTAGLQHGPYVTPPVIKGCHVVCGVRGVVTLVGLSSGAIPWPLGEKDGEQSLVVYKGLATALRWESVEAISAAWGVSVATVKRWQAVKIEKPPQHVGKGSAKRSWTPEEDAAVLGSTDLVRTAALLGRTVAAVKYRRYCLDRGQARAADRMRKAARKRRKP
jgi:hypothetical protein